LYFSYRFWYSYFRRGDFCCCCCFLSHSLFVPGFHFLLNNYLVIRYYYYFFLFKCSFIINFMCCKHFSTSKRQTRLFLTSDLLRIAIYFAYDYWKWTHHGRDNAAPGAFTTIVSFTIREESSGKKWLKIWNRMGLRAIYFQYLRIQKKNPVFCVRSSMFERKS
jgi:hypothetical protein